MKLTLNTCYSRLLFLMCTGEGFGKAVSSFKLLKGPYYDLEGFSGYIEVEVEFEVRDLTLFAKLWDNWLTTPDDDKLYFYKLAKGIMP